MNCKTRAHAFGEQMGREAGLTMDRGCRGDFLSGSGDELRFEGVQGAKGFALAKEREGAAVGEKRVERAFVKSQLRDCFDVERDGCGLHRGRCEGGARGGRKG